MDIEDEPLSSADDFLKDIFSIKQGKTVEKQKKAAVQFLRGAVCCVSNLNDFNNLMPGDDFNISMGKPIIDDTNL